MALSNIIEIIINANDNATAVLKGTAASIGDTTSKLNGISANATASGKALTEGLTIPIVGIAAAAVKMAGDFQASMTRLVTSAGESESNLAAVSAGVMQIANETGTSTTALATAMYTVESGGQHGADGLEVLKAAAQGAKTENADLATVADAVTSAMTDYHLAASQAADVTSKLVAATGQGKTTFQDLAGAMSAILPKASAAGISLNEILGDLASMTLHGISAQQAAQNLADAVSHLQNPLATQSKEMAALGLNSTELAQNLGSTGLAGTIQEISAAIQNDMGTGSTAVILNMEQALQGLPQSVQDVSQQVIDGSASWTDWNKATKDLTVTQKAQADAFETLFNSMHTIGTEQMSGAQVMQTYAGAMSKAMGTTDGLNVALMLSGQNSANTANAISAVSSASADASGNVQGWADVQATFNTHLSQFEASLQTSAITIGNDLLPSLTKLVDKITAGVNWFEQLNPQQRKFIEQTAGMVAVLGPVLLITGKLAESVVSISKAFKLASGAMSLFKTTGVVSEAASAATSLGSDAGLAAGAGEATGALAGAGGLLAILGPIALGLAGVAGGAAIAYLAVKHFQDLGKFNGDEGTGDGSGAGAQTSGAASLSTLAQITLNNAHTAVDQAVVKLKADNDALTVSNKNLAAATTGVTTAQAAVNKALLTYGPNSVQYRSALATLTTAQQTYTGAVQDNISANLDDEGAIGQLKTAQEDLANATTFETQLNNELNASINGTAGAIANLGPMAQAQMYSVGMLQGGINQLATSWNGVSVGIQSQSTIIDQMMDAPANSILQLQGQVDKLNASMQGGPINDLLSIASTGKTAAITISGSLTGGSTGITIKGSMQGNAMGTDFAGTDAYIAGENGPELITGAKGSKVLSAKDTQKQMSKTITVAIGSVINNTQADVSRLVRDIGWRLQSA